MFCVVVWWIVQAYKFAVEGDVLAWSITVAISSVFAASFVDVKANSARVPVTPSSPRRASLALPLPLRSFCELGIVVVAVPRTNWAASKVSLLDSRLRFFDEEPSSCAATDTGMVYDDTVLAGLATIVKLAAKAPCEELSSLSLRQP